MTGRDLPAAAHSPYLWPYMDGILSGQIVHCRYQELMLENLLLPVLARPDVWFDEGAVAQGLTLQKYFPYDLLPWEVFLFAVIAGVKFVGTNDIYFDEIRIIVGRGNGKNGFIDFLAFYFISPAHGVMGYDVDLLANSEEQAKTSFSDLFQLITQPADPRQARALAANFHATLTVIEGLKTHSAIRYNTSSKRGKDSKRTGCLILDETHEYLDFSNINTLRSGMGKRRNSRVIEISTNGNVRGAVFDRRRQQDVDTLRFYNPENRTFVFWCRIEQESEWEDPACWGKANPSLDAFPTLRAQMAKEVREMPYNLEYFPEFMAKRMNFPVGNKDLEVASWEDICATDQPLIDLEGRPCVGGIDYARTNDFVSCFLRFRVGGMHYLIQHTFICAQSRDLPGIKAPLREWEAKGDVEFVYDVEVPAALVAEWFAGQAKRYQVLTIAIDSFRFSLLSHALRSVGFDAKDRKNIWLVRPSDLQKAFPVINSAFVTHTLAIGDCPVFRWAANNTKKERVGQNWQYAKIEPNYRKNDPFMAFAATFAVDHLLPEGEEAESLEEFPDLMVW